MDCTQSIEFLSDYYEGALGETLIVQIREHLSCCEPCISVFRDLEIVITRAALLREEAGVTFPDEDAVWLRMGLQTA